MIKNIIALFLISISLSLFGYLYLKTEKKPLNPFQTYLVNEIEKKEMNHEVPKGWNLIKNVKYKYQSKKSSHLLGDLPFIKINKKGIYRLEIVFMDEPASTEFILIQFNLINIKTNNLIHEFFLRINTKQF